MNKSCHAAAPLFDIPHTLVDTRFVDGKDVTKQFPGYYVEVRDENAVYHVSTPANGCIVNSIAVSRVPIYKDNYDPQTMARYRSNTVFDFAQNKAYVFDFNKNYRTVTLGTEA